MGRNTKNQFFGEDELPRMDGIWEAKQKDIDGFLERWQQNMECIIVRELEIDRNIRKQEEWKDKEEAHREKNDG